MAKLSCNDKLRKWTKFQTKRRTLSEDIVKNVRGLLFFDSPCIYVRVSESVTVGYIWQFTIYMVSFTYIDLVNTVMVTYPAHSTQCLARIDAQIALFH